MRTRPFIRLCTCMLFRFNEVQSALSRTNEQRGERDAGGMSKFWRRMLW